MNKIKFVLPIAVVLGVAFVLSCTNAEEALQQSQCSANQGTWDEATKQCMKCPDGTTRLDGQCIASAIQLADGSYACPAGTALNKNKMCVAGIIAVDPNATKGKFYCDYGKLDPLAEGTHNDCIEIEYASQCDTWGKLVSSCQDKDRRNDIRYCDYGPVNEWGGGCYWVLDTNDCDKDWGIISNKCGTQAQWTNGTICPTGEGRFSIDKCNTNSNTTSKYCFYGKATECWEINGYGDVKTEADCEANFGMVTTTCSNVTWQFCDWGQPIVKNDGKVDRGCFAIRTTKDRSDCQGGGGTIRNSCPTTYTCPTGTKKADWGWNQFACEPIEGVKPTPTVEEYCYYGKASNCWPIGNATDKANCEGLVVKDCNNVSVSYCDYGQPTISGGIAPSGLLNGGCWAITKDQCLGTVRSSCPKYTCPVGSTEENNDGYKDWGSSGGCKPNNVTTTTKYCYYGKASECWPIDGYGDIKTETDCEVKGFGMVVANKEACNNVVLDYCDWGSADGGCWSIRTAKQRNDCPASKIVSSCPNYSASCPAGKKPITDYGWGDSGCESID